MTRFKRIMQISIVIVCLIVGTRLLWTQESGSKDVYALTSENIQEFADIYREIAINYVDEIDPEKVMDAGIEGMLDILDPYTTYVERDDKEQLQIFTQGKYQGVGMLLNYRNNILTVADPPYLGTPSARAGIRAGDTILEVDGFSTKEMGFNKSVKKIRGPKGTEVTLTIKRHGESKNLEFTLIREEITIEDVAYSGLIDDGIGYIQLNRFSKNAAREVAQSLQKLQNRGMKHLIFDLRYNPGGVLEASTQMADLFLPKGAEIVSTKGRTKSSIKNFVSMRDPIFKTGSLIVLVNHGTASASEIFAGAIQDHDRGVVVGDTTFGKGLVQTIFPLSQISALKMTTAKYYTPSGRCIQKQHYFDSDSLIDNGKTYKTVGGREVYGGGGIAPDIYVELPEVTPLLVDLRRKSHFFNFTVQYTSSHKPQDSTVVINKKVMDAFQVYLDEKEYSFKHPLEKHLDALKEEISSNGYDKNILKEIEDLEKALISVKKDMYDKSIDDMKKVLKRELASKYFGTKAEVELGLEEDAVIAKAKSLIKNKKDYLALLEVK